MLRSLALPGCLLFLLLPAPVRAQLPSAVHRCTAADGNAVFTDRACSDMHAQERVAPTRLGNGRPMPPLRGCAHRREDLVQGVRAALESQDVNRLAGYYLWTGIDARSAYALMTQLSRVSERPVVDVRLVAAAGEQASAAPLEANSAERSLGIEPAAAAGGEAPSPGLIRIEQATSASDAGARTSYFRLQAQAGCWWIRF